MKNFLAHFRRVEFVLKSSALASIAGGVNAVFAIYSGDVHPYSLASYFTLLKARFVAGAVGGLVLYWMKSPFTISKGGDLCAGCKAKAATNSQ